MTAKNKTFSQKIYEIVKKIPKGKTLTYKEVAQKARRPKAYRAVGNILNKNYDPTGLSLNALSVIIFIILREFFSKFLRQYGYIVEKIFKKIYQNLKIMAKTAFSDSPDIPCHRVIRSDGQTGGYNRGVKQKIKILKKEGAIK